MQELEERSGGVWRPSPGSIYPALSQLEDEGLVRSDESAGRRAFQLTDAGRAYLEENREALGSPWDDVGGDMPEGLIELRKLMMQLGIAPCVPGRRQAQTAEARKVLEDARRSLYRILAGDAGDEPAADRPASGPARRVLSPTTRRAAPAAAPRACAAGALLAQRAGRQPWQAGSRRALQRAALARLTAGTRSSSVRAHSRGRSTWRSRSRARAACGPPLGLASRRGAATSPSTLASCWT